jgi:hypothetical protein
MWMNKCRNYRVELALLAGNDLDAAARLEVERHLATCPDCRVEWMELQAGQRALERARETPAEVEIETPSIWCEVQPRIRVVEDRAARGSWRGWLPAAAMAAACLAVLVISTDMLRDSQTNAGLPRQPVYSPGFPVLNYNSASPTIVPAGAEDFASERLDAPESEGRPRRRSNRVEWLGNGPFRGF